MIVNTHEAKTQLSRLIERAAAGEEIILGKAGTPMAKLVPYSAERAPRQPGALAGRIRMAPDFDQTPAEVLEAFEGP
ncbi:MAG: type II toxin-antitoxin system prevent-host-death family antitoxin [Acidimicrobiales bacterium]|nr:type II toxin-antitoxin system prevent-host-death family antitoxin [Acidimicrobiales bacterium]